MKKVLRKLAGFVMAGAMFVYMPAEAFSHSYNPANGNIDIVVTRDGDRIVLCS